MDDDSEGIVIIGAGISGLSTSLGLHRLGIRSVVLESSDRLRVTGFALTLWTNAWKALDALGVGDSLRSQHNLLKGHVGHSITTGLSTSDLPFKEKHEARCVMRKVLLETLEKELPPGTIRFSSKLVSIEDLGFFKLLHLADGTSLKAKVLVGCDGVNSIVANWLGFKKPAYTSRSSIRGFAYFKENHGFESKLLRFVGEGIRFGIVPSDDQTLYWFFTFTPTPQDKEVEENPAEMKRFVLSKLANLSEQTKAVVDITEVSRIVCTTMRFRYPWDLLFNAASQENVCIAGDALHPMTPDLSQGGCSALEDGIILSRCLGKALSNQQSDEQGRIMIWLDKYGNKRRYRAFQLIAYSFVVGFLQQSDGMFIKFVREKVLGGLLAGVFLKMAEYDCGGLN